MNERGEFSLMMVFWALVLFTITGAYFTTEVYPLLRSILCDLPTQIMGTLFFLGGVYCLVKKPAFNTGIQGFSG